MQHFPVTFRVLLDSFMNENQIALENIKLEFCGGLSLSDDTDTEACNKDRYSSGRMQTMLNCIVLQLVQNRHVAKCKYCSDCASREPERAFSDWQLNPASRQLDLWLQARTTATRSRTPNSWTGGVCSTEATRSIAPHRQTSSCKPLCSLPRTCR